MTFVNVPSTESADYINAQKNEFEDTYYVDNLNTLGTGGGSSVVFSARSTTSSYSRSSSCSCNIAWDAVVHNCGASSCGSTITLCDAGTYVIDVIASIASNCGANTFVANVYVDDACACSVGFYKQFETKNGNGCGTVVGSYPIVTTTANNTVVISVDSLTTTWSLDAGCSNPHAVTINKIA